MAGGERHPLRSAVVGCGAIADEHLRFLSTSPLADLTAVCDASLALAEIAKVRHGAPRAFDDLDDLLASETLDVLHVLTPAATHPVIVRSALGLGVHVVCEKPLAPDAGETRALLDLARTRRRTVVETRNLLYNDIIGSVDRAIAAGSVGDIREIDVSLSLPLGDADVPPAGTGLPGGVAHDYLPHLAYVLLHFAPPSATVGQVTGVMHNLSGRRDIGFDHVDVLVGLNGVRGRLRISPDIAPDALRLVLRGSRGSLEADLYQPYLRREGGPWTGSLSPLNRFAEGAQLIIAGSRGVRDKLMQHGSYHGMPRNLAAVYKALTAGQPSPVSEEEMVASASLIDRIVALAGEGQ